MIRTIQPAAKDSTVIAVNRDAICQAKRDSFSVRFVPVADAADFDDFARNRETFRVERIVIDCEAECIDEFEMTEMTCKPREDLVA